MTEENKRRNVHFEWERAAESLREVDALMECSLWAAAVSRAYYGVFYLARALLFSLGLETKSHGGITHLLSVHLVRTGEIPAELVRSFGRMQRLREDADYETALVFDERAAQEARESLAEFRVGVARYLGEKGFIS